jgi:hypothetical protein
MCPNRRAAAPYRALVSQRLKTTTLTRGSTIQFHDALLNRTVYVVISV